MNTKTFRCRCGKTIKESEACWFHIGDGNMARECEACAKSIEGAIADHAASQARWEQDFGDRPVYDYDTGKKVADTASEYLKSKKEKSVK